ncbi:MAG: hypothetical protein ACKO2P_01605 [Planctomycetota bacterium]
MGMPFIDLSSAEAIKALKGRKEFGYEILKEEAFRNEVRILNHPTKEEATDAVYKHLEQKDKNDRDSGKLKKDAPPTQPTIGRIRRLAGDLYSRNVYSQMSSVVGMEFPKPVPSDPEITHEQQVANIYRAEQLFLGLNSVGYSIAPILGSDAHLKIGRPGEDAAFRVRIDKFNAFTTGGATVVYTDEHGGRRDDMVEDALRRRQVSIVTPPTLPERGFSAAIDVPLLRLTHAEQKAVVQFEGVTEDLLPNIRLQLLIANADRLGLSTRLPRTSEWGAGENWDKATREDGAFTIVTLPTKGGEFTLPANTAFAYARAIIRRAGKTESEILGLTAPISFNLNRRLGPLPAFKGPVEPLKLDGEIRLRKQDLLTSGDSEELDWSVESSDPTTISVDSDEQTICIRPLAEGAGQLRITVSDGVDDVSILIPVIADKEGLMKQYLEMLRRGEQLEAAQSQVARSLNQVSADIRDQRENLISLEKDAQKQAARAAAISRDLTAAQTALGTEEKSLKEAQERLRQTTVTLESADRTVSTHREAYQRLDAETKAAGERFRDLEARRQAAWQQYVDAPKKRKEEARARWESLRDQANAAELEWRGLQQRRNGAETTLANARSDRDSAAGAVTKARQTVDQLEKSARDRRKTLDDLTSRLKTQQEAITGTLRNVTEKEKGLKRSEDTLATLMATLGKLDGEVAWLSATAARLGKVTWIPEMNVSSFLRHQLGPRMNQQKNLRDDAKVLNFDLGVEFKRIRSIRDLFA